MANPVGGSAPPPPHAQIKPCAAIKIFRQAFLKVSSGYSHIGLADWSVSLISYYLYHAAFGLCLICMPSFPSYKYHICYI